jgi:hypothetical protein
MHSIIGHVSINNTSAVVTYYLMIKRIIPLGILGICIRTSPMSVSACFIPLQMQMKRMKFLREKGTVESEYDDDFNDGED